MYRGVLFKETPAEELSCEFYEIFKNTCFEEHLGTAASIYCMTLF